MSEFLKGSDHLIQSIVELKTNFFSPEAITKFWKAKLQADGKRIGLDISVPDCNWTEKEIRKPMTGVKGKKVPSMMVYVPQELTGQEGFDKLGQMYPKMKFCDPKAGPITQIREGIIRRVREETLIQDSPDGSKKGGWIKVEATIITPNLNTTQEDLEKHAQKLGYSSQTLSTYILVSQARKNLTGHYLDKGSRWSRLDSRYDEEDVVCATFGWDGFLALYFNLRPQDYNPRTGGRFEEVKKA